MLLKDEEETMPYCTECGYEYAPGVLVCPDCQAPLAEGNLTPCESCEELIDPAASFCRHCGVYRSVGVQSTKAVCEKHADRKPLGRCVFCGKLVCDECAVRKYGRIFCDNDEHVKMMSDWVVAFTTGTQYEAQMIKANLEGAGIPTMVFSQSDRMYYTTVGDLAVTEVMVPKQMLDDARQYLNAMDQECPEDQPEA